MATRLGHSIWLKIEVLESFQQDDYCHDAMDHWRQYFRIYITKENIKKHCTKIYVIVTLRGPKYLSENLAGKCPDV